MDESAIKGLKSLDLNDSGAESRNPSSTSTSTTISVEGYDTWLPKYLLELRLRKHFSSCGEFQNIFVPRDYERGIIKSVAFMRIKGEGAEDKALALNGTDMGGWTAIVKAAPSQKVFHNITPVRIAAPASKLNKIFVSGCDTSLPEIDLQISLCQHFSSCGDVWEVHVFPRGKALLNVHGEKCVVVDKALNLNRSNMEGMTLVVEPSHLRRGCEKKRFRMPVGYTPPSILREVAKKKKRMESEEAKKKKRMETKKIKKKKKIEKENMMNI